MKRICTILLFVLTFTACKKANSQLESTDKIESKVDTITSVDSTEIDIKKLMASYSRSYPDTLPVQFLYDQETNPKYSLRLWQGIPSIGITSKNELIAVWYSGGKGENPGNYLTLSSSSDLGKTWKNNQLIVAGKTDTVRMMDPALWNDKYGYLHLSWTYSVGMWDGGQGGVWQSIIYIKDGKIKYTNPTKLFKGVMLNKPTSSDDKLNILFTSSGWNISKWWEGNVWKYPLTPTPDIDNGAFIYSANYDDVNKTFSPPVKLSKIPIDNNLRAFDEHYLLNLGNKHLACFLRSGGDGIYVSHSYDSGLTWLKCEKFISLGITNSTRFHVKRLKSGNILFILNNSAERTDLTAYLSLDNGVSWTKKLILDKRSNVSYPDAVQDANGNIFIIYDRDRFGLQEIDFLKITESEIIANNSSPTATIISKK